ncbi:hypothetical protein SAMN05216289_10666 [Dokdonella immobilis]|uniref:DUF4440 domain-containing protein n=1 Tax=Dokdonella immobilis TaxID=578942 RepID=A0A1I4WTZ0_9GAMM|nr:hypothetical protein SAMN05216289_10666 [Dokdonella immobilis]
MRNATLIHALARRAAALLALGLLLAGCASEGTRPDAKPDGKVAEKRAIERWEFLIKHEAEKAYDYLSPGFRATKSREDYAKEMNNRPIRWTRVLPYRSTCDKPDVCVLDLQIDFATKMPGVGTDVSSVGFVKETWLRTGGKWYLLPEAKSETGGK